MAKYDVYRVNSGLVLNVQADILDTIKTKMVIPLVPDNVYSIRANRLNPSFKINDVNYVLLTQSMSSVPTKILGEPITNLAEHFADITNALDMLFQGY